MKRSMSSELRYYGELISAQGLEPVMEALDGSKWSLVVRRSGFDGTEYLRMPLGQRTEVDFEMDSGQNEAFLFSGSVAASVDRAVELLGSLSSSLSRSGFVHRVELYDSGKKLVAYFHHDWPQKFDGGSISD